MSDIIKRENSLYPYLTEPVEIITFANGHKLVLAKKESTMMNISSWVNTGSINENEDNNGVSHFLEHLMFKGTHKYKAGEFDKTLERKGAIINAATWKDYTFYYVTIPKEEFELALHMHADMMIDPCIPENEIGTPFDINGKEPDEKRERYVVIEEIRMGQDRSQRKVYNTLNDIMYEKHPYKRDVIGKKEIIAAIKREDILNYYKSFYTPQNITTVITGEFEDKEYIIKKVQEEFKFQNFTDFKKLSADNKTIETKIKSPKTVEKEAEINSSYIMYGFLADTPVHYKESIALDLISTILGDGKSSRLYNDLIENVKEPYVYDVSAFHYRLKDGDNFFIELNFNPEYKSKVIQDINNELDNLKNIKEDELEKAKKAFQVDFAQEAETVSNIADSIGEFMTLYGNLDFANCCLEYLKEIDTDYLKEIVEKYLPKEFASVSILVPERKNK